MQAESSVKDEIIHQYHDFRQMDVSRLDEPTLRHWSQGFGWNGSLDALDGWARSMVALAVNTTGDQFFDFVTKDDLPEGVDVEYDREVLAQINACMVRTYRNVNRSFGRGVIRGF